MRGMRSTVDQASPSTVVIEADSVAEAVRRATRESPHVIIYGDAELSHKELVILTRTGCQVLLLIDESDTRSVIRGRQAGVRGFISRRMAVEELIGAITAVTEGNAFLSPSIADKVLDLLARQYPDSTASWVAENVLSDREREVLRLLGEGSTDDEIAEFLRIGKTTVRSHIYHITTKLQLSNRVQAAVFGCRYFLRWQANLQSPPRPSGREPGAGAP